MEILFFQIIHEYLVRASDLVLEALKNCDKERATDVNISADVPIRIKTLTYIMFHIDDKPFDQVRLTNFTIVTNIFAPEIKI